MVGNFGFIIEEPDLLALQGGETKAQLWSSEQRAQLGLQAVEAGGGNERFAINEITFDRRQDLLIRDFQRMQYNKPTKNKKFRGEEGHKDRRITEDRQELGGQARGSGV